MMSIYQSRFKRPINDDDVTSPVMRGGTPKPACLPPARQDWAQVWSHRRKAIPSKYIMPMSIKWLMSMPKHVRPLALVAKYPRIANQVALQWSKSDACRTYLDDLLVDRRSNRKGFPADVQHDLRTLRDYYYSLHQTSLHLTLVE